MDQDEHLIEIEAELQQAGQDPALRRRWEELERRRITPFTELPPMEFLFKLFGKPCFPRGELVALGGKAKSGKTYISSLLMAAGSRPPRLPTEGSTDAPVLQNNSEAPLHVLWVDTEQSEESTQDILRNRIMPLAGADTFPSEHFDVFNLRGEFWQDRQPLLEAAIAKFQSDLVIIDGIRDLVDDINDARLAQNVIEGLMRTASDWHCCIICILHMNKSGDDRNLRGWLGTELKNKAFEVWECAHPEEGSAFTFEQVVSRKHPISEKLAFTIDETSGLPVFCPQSQALHEATVGTQSQTPKAFARPSFNETYVLSRKDKFIEFDLTKLFGDALNNVAELDEERLCSRVMALVNMTSTKLYYSVLNKAINAHVVQRRVDAFKRVTYAIA